MKVHSIIDWAHPNNTYEVVNSHQVSDGVGYWYLSENERAECLNPDSLGSCGCSNRRTVE